jgi:hypothetical protein
MKGCPMTRGLIVCLALIALTGCATGGAGLKSPSEILADLKVEKVKLDAFTYADLLRAVEIANTPPVDQAGAACWPVLAAKFQARMHAQTLSATGVASFFEKVRKIVRPQGAPDDSLDTACSALRDQTLADLVKIEAQIAGMVASGGISGISSVPDALRVGRQLLGLMRELGVSLR